MLELSPRIVQSDFFMHLLKYEIAKEEEETQKVKT